MCVKHVRGDKHIGSKANHHVNDTFYWRQAYCNIDNKLYTRELQVLLDVEHVLDMFEL